ncbi:MAG: lysine--tRNA ligase [Gemmatimonadota bacterium]|nr:MAG: lysine--tRNA ligase [Gemmatimonadota bacterium]
MEETSELRQQRLRKLEEIRQLGINPYPYAYEVSHTSKGILDSFEHFESSQEKVSIAGRLMTVRRHGKTSFAHVEDDAGRLQIYIRLDDVGQEAFDLFQLFDIGDIIGVRGHVFRTRTGEVTVQVETVTLLSKSLRPLPEKWHGLRDKEIRYRQRYLDLIMNPDVKETFRMRTEIIRALRSFLDARGFLEVETPVLQPIYGGASARPFITHHNALDVDFYLRIADELYLKRLIVGGFEKVYEFAKDFRNEGMDRTHQPEFTQMELYQAYIDYNDLMELVEEMISTVAQRVLGKTDIAYQGHRIDLSPPWERLSLFESIQKYADADLYGKNVDELRAFCDERNLKVDERLGPGKLIDEIYSELVEPYLMQPTFIKDHPVDMSPLAKRHRDKSDLTERFEPVIGGGEIGNAFSELNDPLDQRERFEQQRKLLEDGDEEAQVLDEDFLRAMEYGMPPMAGLGIGIDRLVMLFTNSPSIRDVILFPQMRPEREGDTHGMSDDDPVDNQKKQTA